MATYLLRRILLSIPVLIGILFVTFTLAHLIPSDPCRAMLGEKATDEVCDDFLRRHGLDKPIPVQFVVYMGEILQGDFGRSFRYSMPVTEILAQRLRITIELAFAALFISVIVGIPLGVISAVRHNSWADVTTMLWANIGVSMPVFWLGLMLACRVGQASGRSRMPFEPRAGTGVTQTENGTDLWNAKNPHRNCAPMDYCLCIHAFSLLL